MLYPWVSLTVLVLAVLFMPKRLTLRENILVFATIGYIVWNGHLIVGIMLDLYNLGRSEKIEFLDWLLVTLAPALIAVLYLNFKKTDKYLLYAVTWAILSFFFEWGLVFSDYMDNIGWKTWYSIPVYLMAFLFLPWFLNVVIRRSNSEYQKKYSFKSDSIKKIRFKEKAK